MTDIVKENSVANYILEQVLFDIKEMPAADVKEIIHAEWIGKPLTGFATVRCSNCKNVFYENSGKWRYCPQCGAKMDLKNK